ncbi:hypothetical protein [Desulfosporosinus nitroreducens]|uniref:hypothetical protein n=1 Tax=Desulfosporosinus nitroreducens TaxID=2018668 RepID=UPI00207C3CB0|nr:hypothetical protein [Desulfosporosinus nitroreducens]MCO1604051.1 hypothetical protein [Desulfosporosinus nitroreducens]
MAKVIVKATESIIEVAAQKVDETKVDTILKFSNRLIINGEAVETAPKKVEVTINGKKITLKCRIIPDNSIATAYSNSFIVPVKEKEVQVFYVKGGGVLAASLYVNSKLEYSGISMQGIFAILQECFGVDKLIADRLYIAGNANRKKPPEAKAKEEPTKAL